MESRQRILQAFAHKKPDRCPNYIWINDDAMSKLIEYLGVSSPIEAKRALNIDKWSNVELNISPPKEIKRKIKTLVPEKYKNNENYQVLKTGRVVRIHEQVDYLEDTVFHPLEGIHTKQDLCNHPLPPDEKWIEDPNNLEKKIEKDQNNGYIVSGEVKQPFKMAWQLRGMKRVFRDFWRSEELISSLYDHIYSFINSKGLIFVKKGVDMIKIVGDLGMQDGLMINPDTWRKFDKHRLKSVINSWKRINPNLHVYMHTDGDVKEIIPDLIESGVDILNPIQPECMDPVEIKEEFGDKLVLHGAVSLQETLPLGTPREVEKEVKYLIKKCNTNGGFIIGPSNALFKEIPMENIITLYNSVY